MKKGLVVAMVAAAVAALASLATAGAFSGTRLGGRTQEFSYNAGQSPITVNTGGKFLDNVTEVGAATIAPGTYRVTLNAKVSPETGGSGSVQVFPGLFLYTQDAVANQSFDGNVLNICNGPLEWGTNYQIDGYCSGSMVLTLTETTTFHVYAFGYDSDRGAGHYLLDDAELYVTRT